MTASEFEIAFYEAMAKWAQGGKVDPDPRGKWEYSDISGKWHQTFAPSVPEWDLTAYRWKLAKKRTVTLDGVELVAPEVEAPALMTNTFVAGWVDEIIDVPFVDEDWCYKALANGKVFLTREDCQAMADAQRKQRLDQQSKPVVTDEMVTRFLGWSLPKDFAPDCGISFDGRKDENWCWNKTWPVGTNLLTADQAKVMLEHVIGGAS